MSWFISSFLAWLSLRSFQRVRPTLRVGMMRRGMTRMPTQASCQDMLNRATSVVTTVATLLTMLVRVP